LLQIKGIREQNMKNLEQQQKKKLNVIKFNLSENNVSVVGRGKK